MKSGDKKALGAGREEKIARSARMALKSRFRHAGTKNPLLKQAAANSNSYRGGVIDTVKRIIQRIGKSQ